MSKELLNSIKKLLNENDWTNMLEISMNKLIILDCYQDWCGRCEAIIPTFSRVLLDYDNALDRILFTTVSINSLNNLIIPSLPSDCNVQLDKNGCIPIFLVFRFKSCISVIVGVDAPALMQVIQMNIPDKLNEPEII
mmetsp:Transcript_5921/g.5306  ORF Transcript_5921/g.5306 Transcript_5921/m.5306 type:complete len:137 (+) Transcript_5921:54-464(+)